MTAADWDLTAPWNAGVRGDQVLPLINIDASVIRVQAGPGTGKTFGIRRRVLRILHPDGLECPSTDVLVCSFNRAIAEDLKAEISAELADYHLEPPTVRTIHSLAVQFAATSPRFLLPHEEEAMICDVLAEHQGLAARYPRVAQARRALREHESGIQSHPDLTFAAQGWMARHHASMVGDTPREVERRLAQGDEPEHRYRHVIVDEFQDLTETEAKLVLGLRTPDAEFVALGDRKQSIYAFRGNAEKGLDALPDLVAPEEVLDLTMDECQRCSAEIVEVGNALMQLEGEPMVSSRQEPAEIHMLTFTSPQREARGMARHIVDTYRRHRDEEPRPKHLVLVTRRKWGYDLRREIAQYAPDVDAQTIFAEDILETWPAREAFIYLSVLGNPEDAPALRSWVGYRTVEDGTGFKSPRRNAGCYVGLLGDGRAPLDVDRARQLADGPASALTGAGRSTVHQRLQRLRDLWDGEDHGAPTADIVRTILDPARWVPYGGDAGDLAQADIERLRTEALALLDDDNGLTLPRLVSALRYRIATREPLGEGESPDIRIVTLWGAKGLTADYVYLVGLVDEALPGKHDADSTGLNEAEWLDEQRRLLYVSLTRAKRALVMSRPRSARVGELAALGMATPRGAGARRNLSLPRFLRELDPRLLPAAVNGDSWPGLQG